jgi:hypothetical protein
VKIGWCPVYLLRLTVSLYEDDTLLITDQVDLSHDEAVRILKTMYGANADQVLQSRWQVIRLSLTLLRLACKRP